MTTIDDYHDILQAKNVDPNGKFVDHQEFNNAITAWRQDILAKKVCFTANYKTDWKFFMECNHSVYGIWKCPQYHEYSKRERISVFLCCCSLFAIVSIISVTTQHEMEQDNESAGSIFIATNCINIIGAILIGVSEEILKLMATCPCFQTQKESRRNMMERIGHVIMGAWIIFGICGFISGLVVAIEWGLVAEYFIAILTNVLGFCVVPTLILTGVFSIMWNVEQKQDLEKIKFNVCYQDYLDFTNKEDFKRVYTIDLSGKKNNKTNDKEISPNKVQPTTDEVTQEEVNEP